MCTAPKPSVFSVRLIDVSLMIFGLEEHHIPAKEERVAYKHIQIKYILDAMDMPNTTLQVKESTRTGRYSQDIRRHPVKITFSTKLSSQKVLKQAKKQANNAEFSEVFV